MNIKFSSLYSNKRDWYQSGFTLVELMVTVSLLAFMGLMAATSFDTGSWLANQRLKGAARELSMNMQKVRMNAIKENRQWGVFFNTGGISYELRSAGPDNNWSTADDVVDVTVTLPTLKSGISFGFGGANLAVDNTTSNPTDPVSFVSDRVVFNTRGFANAGTCYLTNDHGGAMAVVARTTGSIDLRKWKSNKWE
jgi:prepilin-type N-terminal cleavage/methylation domain-containing protein